MFDINDDAIKAIETFEKKFKGKFVGSMDRLVISFEHDKGIGGMTSSSFNYVQGAISDARRFAEKGIVIESIKVKIINPDEDDQIFDIYPTNENNDN